MKKLLLTLFLWSLSLYGHSQNNHYLYDVNHVRYELYQTNKGKNYNWLFFPGGPGADSSYLRSLVDELSLPGNVWLIDLPGNGSNIEDSLLIDYDQWADFFLKIIKQFDNPVLVGHSFGGMFPLLFPELENHLKGFVILNSTPTLWLEETATYSKQFDLPDLSEKMGDFAKNPTQATFNAALEVCMPYYFPPASLEKGKAWLSQIACQWQPAVWWLNKAIESNFSAKWIPQNVPTLIIGSKYDCICPFSLFKNDARFHRKNIQLLFIENGGHCPWIESPAILRKAFAKFCSQHL